MRHHRTWIASLPAGLALLLMFGVFRLLPLDRASTLGGWLGRKCGPHLKWHRVAQKNLQFALPERREEHAEILTAMWDNLGRTLAEYPWLGTEQLASRIILPEGTDAYIAKHPQVICGAAHLGNWEIAPFVAKLQGLPLVLIYRHLSNRMAEALILWIRRRYAAEIYPKGHRGAAEALRALKTGKSLGMLVDQKMNQGIMVPFFDQPAMTAPAIAQLALRFHTPILLARVIREHGAHFRFEIEEIQPQGEVSDILQVIHRRLEGWIREYPSQWLWIHRRWGKI